MRSWSSCVTIQQPAEILLKVCVVDAWVIEPQGLTAKPIRGIDEESHRPLQNGYAVQSRHPLDDHVLLHTAQPIKDKAVNLEGKVHFNKRIYTVKSFSFQYMRYKL